MKDGKEKYDREIEKIHFVSRDPPNDAGCKWQAEIPRDRQRGQHPKGEMPENTASHVFDPCRVGEACRAALRNGCDPDSGVAAAKIQPEDFNDPDDMYWNVQQGSDRKRGTGAKTKEGSAEPWWRTQISQQMDHARLESTERHRRQRIASVLAENEQHRRVAEQAACEMEDEQERVRRREFAKIVLDEEQHTRVREKHLAEDRDLADRNRRRRWAVKALREQEARITMERLHLREIEQGRADPRAPLSRTLVEAAVNRQSTMKRNRALLLAGLELHVHYIRVIEERGKREQSISRRSKVDQMIVDMYTRDCLDVKAAQKESRVASLIAKPCFGSVSLLPTSFEENLLQLRERALKQDFTTAVNARAGAAPSVRALSSYAIQPASWSGNLARNSSARYQSAGSAGVGRGGQEKEELARTADVLVKERLFARENREKPYGDTAGWRRSPQDVTAAGLFEPTGIGQRNSLASTQPPSPSQPSRYSITSLLQRSLLMPTVQAA